MLNRTLVGSFFAGGIRAYSFADLVHDPVEIGYLVEAALAKNATHTIQINDIYVDENGLIYANDRLSGGLDINKAHWIKTLEQRRDRER